jgi:hypothetical protein
MDHLSLEFMASVSRHFLEDTLVLETDFENEDGFILLIDFVRLGNDGAQQLVRIVEGHALSAASGSKRPPGPALLTALRRTSTSTERTGTRHFRIARGVAGVNQPSRDALGPLPSGHATSGDAGYRSR